MNTLLLFLACLAVFGLLWLVLNKKKPQPRNPAVTLYTCDHCGEQDCTCHPETSADRDNQSR